jgi:hypothetical protein
MDWNQDHDEKVSMRASERASEKVWFSRSLETAGVGGPAIFTSSIYIIDMLHSLQCFFCIMHKL